MAKDIVPVQLSGSIPGETLKEQLTQTNAVDGVVTFSEDIEYLEIFNTDSSNAGVFTVNGISISVPASAVFKSKIGGTLGDTVTITGSTSYILSRYE